MHSGAAVNSERGDEQLRSQKRGAPLGMWMPIVWLECKFNGLWKLISSTKWCQFIVYKAVQEARGRRRHPKLHGPFDFFS